MKNIKLLFYAVSVAVFLGSCTGKDGAPGATGPQGNANVQSQDFQINSWTAASTYYYADLPVSALTSSINDYGAVDVYFSIDGGGSWNAMPYTYLGSTTYYMSDAYNTGTVEVEWTWGAGAGSDPNAVWGVTVQIKVVCVAPEVIKANPNMNWGNYNEVQQKFHLKG